MNVASAPKGEIRRVSRVMDCIDAAEAGMVAKSLVKHLARSCC